MGAAFRVGHVHREIEQVGWGIEIQIQQKSGIFVDWISIVGGAATTMKVWLIVISWATSSAWCGGQPEECLVCFSGRRGLGLLSASGLVDPTSPDVPDPFYHIVVAVVQLWLEHFQITHLQSRRSKWNLKVHRNGWSSPFLFIISG